MTNWTTADIPDQTGRTAVITGANTGLGYETAAALAAKGAHVVLAVRNLDKGKDAADRIAAATPVPSVARAGTRPDVAGARSAPPPTSCASRHDRIDLLINNAGVMFTPKAHHQGRLRTAVRHQPSGPLRADRPAARPGAGGAGLAGGDRQQHRPPLRAAHPLRRSAVGAQLQPGRRLRAVQAGQPAVHLRTAAPAARTGAPSPPPHIPADRDTELMRNLPVRGAGHRGRCWRAAVPGRRHGRAADAAGGHRSRRARRAVLRPRRARSSSAAIPAGRRSSAASHDLDAAAPAVDGVRGTDRGRVSAV